uniref:Uncharacterized protein n=1 Tax=Panagrellus redivivus TaxID=6233 RepID=A0A7E5A1N8_PANRE
MKSDNTELREDVGFALHCIALTRSINFWVNNALGKRANDTVIIGFITARYVLPISARQSQSPQTKGVCVLATQTKPPNLAPTRPLNSLQTFNIICKHRDSLENKHQNNIDFDPSPLFSSPLIITRITYYDYFSDTSNMHQFYPVKYVQKPMSP